MGLHALNHNLEDAELATMVINAERATEFLKALGHEGRLMILCHLALGERSVTELERLLSLRQAAVSQQLARLRLERLVVTRREGKTIYYRLAEGHVRQMIEIIHEMFCAEPDAGANSGI
jgi:ArsR family transcriptional regulator